MIVQSSPAFRRALERLDRSEQLLVLKTVEQIKASEGAKGKELSGPLRNCKSIRRGITAGYELSLALCPSSQFNFLLLAPGSAVSSTSKPSKF